MEFLIIYAGYTVAVAILSNSIFTRYAISTLKAKGIENQITQHQWLTHLTTLIIHMLLAPAMMLILLSTAKTTRFCVALESLLAKD